MERWLDQVANGTIRVVNGQVVGRPPDPAKALDIIAKLAGYAAPKLARAELTVEGDRPASGSVQIEFVNVPPIDRTS